MEINQSDSVKILGRYVADCRFSGSQGRNLGLLLDIQLYQLSVTTITFSCCLAHHLFFVLELEGSNDIISWSKIVLVDEQLKRSFDMNIH
jgi:hypothetical protein